VQTARISEGRLQKTSGVRDDLAYLSTLESDRIGHVCSHVLFGVCRGLLRLEHEHRETGVVLARPVTGHEPPSLRDARHDLLPQTSRSRLWIDDLHPNYDCVHPCLPWCRRVAPSLSDQARNRQGIRDSLGRSPTACAACGNYL